MEALAPLTELLRRGPTSIEQATKLCALLAEELGRVHAQGKVHGRLAPENIRFHHVGQKLRVRLESADIDAAKLRPYLAPEVERGAPSDLRADLYGLGALLHQLISGTVPREGMERKSLLALDYQDVPADLDSLVRALLAPEPRDRPRSARDVKELLEDIALGVTSSGELASSYPTSDETDVLDAPTTESAPPGFEGGEPTQMDLEKRFSGHFSRELPTGQGRVRVTMPPIQVNTDPTIDPYGDTVLRDRVTLEADVQEEQSGETVVPPPPAPPRPRPVEEAAPVPPPQARATTIKEEPEAVPRVPPFLIVAFGLACVLLAIAILLILRG